MKKILTTLCLCALALLCLFALPTTAKAAEAGTLPSNAITLTEGVWRTKYWTNSNYKLNCYNKITVPSRGYITFTIEKPTDSEGEICSFELWLYNPDGSTVWATNTSPLIESFSEYYTYKVGLAAGTYYMNIDPSFYVYRDSAPIPTSYMYTFTAANNWEIEYNGDQSNATIMELDKTYYGVYCEEDYDIPYKDYYGVYLSKGITYDIVVGNYNALDAGTLILKILDPYGEETSFYSSKDMGNAAYKEYKAGYTCWHYIRLDNDGNSAPVEYTLTVQAPRPKLVYKNGVWKCEIDGKPYTVNTLIEHNGKLYHVKGGYWVRDTTLFTYEGKMYYVKNGIVSSETTLVKYNGRYCYVKNGVFTKTTTLVNYNGYWRYVKDGIYTQATTLVKHNGNWLYVKNGVYTKATTLVTYNGKIYYVQNGTLSKATTLVKHSNGSYIYIKNGVQDKSNTLVKFNGKWYHVNGGVWVKDTTLVKYNNNWYYVKNGVMNTGNTLVRFNGNWYHVNGGVWVKDNTLVKYSNEYYHVNKGVWVKDTTLVKYNGNWLYVKGGVYTKATAFVKYNGNTYYVVNGVWSETTTGLIKLSNGSYAYIKNGVQDMSNTLIYFNGNWYHVSGGKWVRDTTLVSRNGNTYYVKNGLVDFSFTGKFVHNGGTYNIVKGVVK